MSLKIGAAAAAQKKPPKEKRRKEPITYYELVELENLKNNPPPPPVILQRHFPIAPDGYVPNSVVQQFFAIYEPEEQPPPIIWKLNWKPTDIIEENVSGQSTPNEMKVLEYDWTDEEEEEKVENEIDNKITEQFDSKEEEDEPARMLSDLTNRMREFEWFEVSNENLNISYLIRYLFGKLIERVPDNHSDICEFIKEINEKFKINQESKDWLILQLEEELDATDDEIIKNNLSLISNFSIETYRIDVALLNLVKKSEYHKEQAFEILMGLTQTNEAKIEFVLENSKKIGNSKYKREENDFRLVKFIEDIEAEIAENLEVSNEAKDVTKNSEIFKTILKEDWIATSIKESFKSLEDFLEYFIKYLKTAKSKIFYEKVANFLYTLYNEFKLGKSDWEIQIIEHFVNNNTEQKGPEALRLIDLENINKYYPMLTDVKQKHQILIELLRSACFEKSRKQVQNISNQMLRDLTGFDEEYMNGLQEFYGCKRFSNVTILSWTETLDLYKNKPLITTEEILEIKELDPSILEVKVDPEIKPTKHETKKHKKGKHKSKKDKGKSKKEKKSKDHGTKTDKNTDGKNDTITTRKGRKRDESNDTDTNNNMSHVIDGETTEDEFGEEIKNLQNPVTGIIRNNLDDEYLRINDAIIERNSENSDLLENSINKQSTDIFLPSPSESISFYKNRNRQYEIDNTIPAPKSSFHQINSEFLEQNVGINEQVPENIKITKELSENYLNGITKRTVFLESRYKMSDQSANLKTFPIHEKCHLIDQNEINNINIEQNIKFESFKANRISREEEYNKLLQCLIIRGLDLHKHYERLIPKGMDRKSDAPAQSGQYYNDILAVHPYNMKNPKGQNGNTYAENKRNIYANLQMGNMNMDEQERIEINKEIPCLPSRKSYKTQPLGAGTRNLSNSNEAKTNETELNHIFLINKLLVSYGAQNLRKFYSSINNDFRSYLNRLHSRIPHRIVPLIWNDPVIQKIAMIVSSTQQLQSSNLNLKEFARAKTFNAESPGLNELKSKLNVKSRPSSAKQVKNNRPGYYPQKYVNGYHVEEQVIKPPAIRTMDGLNVGFNSIDKEQYDYWPIFKQDDSPQNKITKRKLYSHLVNMKNEYVKLQWRYMLQDEKNRKTKSYLPPLSLKATLNSQQQQNQQPQKHQQEH